MKKIEVGKTYKTRTGQEVRIYSVGGGGMYAIRGAVFYGEMECPTTWCKDGSNVGGVVSAFDIVIPPLKCEGLTKVLSFADDISPIIRVPDEFRGLGVKYTLEALE